MNNNLIKQLIPGYLMLLLGMLLMLPIQQLAAQNRRSGGKAAPRTSAPRNTNPAPRTNQGNRSNPSVADRQVGAGNKNIGSNNNKANINNSKKNVNINIDNSKDIRINNSRNTVVRRGVRPYPRPPHVYGGHRYMCYHPYVFHPFRPFVWGPMWHPWGFFVATVAVTAIILSVDNDLPGELDMASYQGVGNGSYSTKVQPSIPGASFASFSPNQVNRYGQSDHYMVDNNYLVQTAYTLPTTTFGFSAVNQEFYTGYNQPTTIVLDKASEYYYDQGVFYIKVEDGYSVVSAPLGATIKTLPSGYETVTLDDNVKNYYYGGAFYEKSSSGYKVVPPTAGAIVEHVSDGAEEVKMGDITYVKLGETYYQPIKENGKDMYEVANVEEDK
jgi:Family of unknown function (DUF6515)